MGVGDSTASPTAALLLSILQESAGRIATILFAHRFGTSLEPECKMYRLLADVLNDIAFILDCLSPVFPKPIRVVVLSFSSVLRALCGVAAGSAKASLSAHFARWGNLGELNAKDSSQETVISLMGMLVGSLVVSWVTTPVATWTVLILLLSIHLETNRRAVRAVSMRTLNRQRATLVYHSLKAGRVPSPREVSTKEHIFEQDGVLRSATGVKLGYCRTGATLPQLLASVAVQQHRQTESVQVQTNDLQSILDPFKNEKYVLWYEHEGTTSHVNIVVKVGAITRDLIQAWWHALCIVEELSKEPISAREASSPFEDDVEQKRGLLERTLERSSKLIHDSEQELVAASWDLDQNALETTSSTRIRF